MAKESRAPNTNKQSGGVTIGDVIGGIRNSIIAGRDVIFPGSTAEQRAQRNRRAMLELVKNTWIKGVLEQSLHGAAMIELGMEERADAVEHPWDMVLQAPDRPNRALPRGTKIADVFDDMNRALLILGEPGSGKTTMLLELARDTIACAEEDPTQPISVVFNLSSWAEKRQPLAEWLVEELNTKYHIPKRIARPWVENDDLLLLLDGLDEVGPEHREACVEAINDFRKEHGLIPLVVCSRVAGYEALTTRLKLQGAVLLQPLTPQQVDQYLEGAGTELLAVRRTLQHDATLQKLAQTPLMLSVMTLAYRGISVEDLGPLDSIETRRRHVFDTYVQRMLKRRGFDQPYSPEQTIHWLAWLARKMKQHAQTVFLIERMDVWWLQPYAQRLLYAFVPIVAVWLYDLLVGALAANLVSWLSGNSAVWLVVGLSCGVAFGLISWFLVIWRDSALGAVQPVDRWWLPPRGGGKGLVLGLILGLISGLVVGKLSGVPFAAPVAGLVLGPSWGLIGYLLDALLRELDYTEGEIEEVYSGSGLLRTVRDSAMLKYNLAGCEVLFRGLVFGLVGGLSVWLIGWCLGGLMQRLNPNLTIGLVLAVTAGPLAELGLNGRVFVRRLLLRAILCLNGHIPWSYVRFLDYAAERIFLRKVGGGYIFVHRLLMEHLATTSLEEGA